MKDINNIIKKVKKTLNTHRVDEGKYVRWLWDDGSQRDLGVNEYGCADAANILYTLNEFISEPEKRQKWVDALNDMQNPETGMFAEPTHHTLHTTAHCTASLELFDAKPRYEIFGVRKYLDIKELYNLLEGLDWKEQPWPQSHQGAGIFAIMNNTGMATYEWNQAYFKWLWDHSDPETGMFGGKYVTKEKLYEHMGGTFHYIFNHEYAKMPLRYPEKLIDSCIWMYENQDTPGVLYPEFNNSCNFIQMDWVYCITRALRQTNYRFDDCKKVLKHFADVYIEYLDNVDENTDDKFNDLHLLFGTMCCLAELQSGLPGYIKSEKPLRLVLDRRPFI